MLVKREPQPQPKNYALIWLNQRVSVKVDLSDYERLNRYHWRLKLSGHCFYAVRRIHRANKTYEVKMHRIIAKTPPGYECHHINKNTLDNRKTNLQNLSQTDHIHEHRQTL